MLNSPNRDGGGRIHLLRRVYSPKLYSEFGSKGTGRYWATTRKRFTVALPSCILLWACVKMQLFLCERHRNLSFSAGRPSCTVLECEQDYPQHFIPWGGFSGPDLKLARGLVDEHLDAGDHLGSPFLGQFQKARFGGIVHHVEDV